MKTIVAIAIILTATSASAQDNALTPEQLDRLYAATQQHDAEVRAANAAHEFFFVSTIKSGLAEMRFYVDRKTVVQPSQYGFGRAWVDSYEVIGAKRPLKIRHIKALEEVRCGNEPQMRFKTLIDYEPDGSNRSATDDGKWVDVIPGSSMETTHRFICDPEPANAFNFVPDDPLTDSLRYFSKQTK